ncbi:flagellin [Planococcus rifietoensis]|uniref:flagellin N-terminal helical domain-containing protein n=1 Tax=Planococcus rifietoensis TaxID=200991 RepID=UPI00384AFAC7
MIINHNIAALNTHRQMGSAQSAQMDNMGKLSSGMRINSAKDDAAGLSISEKMRGQIRGLEQGSRNAQDAISMIQTAEGALSETHDILQRMRELTVQAGNDSYDTDDRTVIQVEIDDLAEEITRISETTQFNGQNLLDATGGTTGTFSFQIGSNKDQQLTVSFAAMDAATLTADTVDVTDSATATASLEILDNAIKSVSDERSQLGSKQNRFEHTINNLNTSAENLTAAESRIRDVDYAEAA